MKPRRKLSLRKLREPLERVTIDRAAKRSTQQDLEPAADRNLVGNGS